MPRKCVSCKATSDSNIAVTTKKRTPNWLKKTNHVAIFKKRIPLRIHQSCRSKLMTLDVTKAIRELGFVPKYLLVWGADPGDITFKLRKAKAAYGNFQNYQVISIRNRTTVPVKLKCPQPYITWFGKTSRAYPRHIHFSFSNESETGWHSRIYTQSVICNLDFKQFITALHNRTVLIINALVNPIMTIPYTYNLPFDTTLRKKQLVNWIRNIANHHVKVPKRYTVYQNMPIIVYCANKKCQAGPKLCNILTDEGFVQVYHYMGGIHEYKKQMKQS